MIIFDTEADNLLDEATRIWVFGWTEDGENIHSTTDYDTIQEVLSQYDSAGCHNSIRYDFPLFEKILGYKYEGLRIDTLALSWYCFPQRSKHGLEDWGIEFGFPKVEVQKDEWAEGNTELMKQRAERDVKINFLLWMKQKKILEELYGQD